MADGTVAEVRDARRGDEAAFRRLHDRYAPMVHAIVLARVSMCDADDIVQEVFVTAWTRLGELRDVDAFAPWIARIARNRAIDHARRRPLLLLEVEPAVGPIPRAEAAEPLRAIQALPESYRETLLCRLVAGMTGPEIAERTGLTEGSVRVNLHRGMQLLRERLGGDR
jgi:RNA polymerase sigma-70 factor (ECF subfamily)